MRSTILLVGITLVVPSFLVIAAASAGPAPKFTATFDAGGLDLAEGLALAPDGSAILAGTVQRSTGKDMVTAKLGTDGKTIWSKLIDRGADDRGADAVVDSSGNVYVAGTVTINGGESALVQKYSSSGEPNWAVLFDKGTAETARALALDTSGNVILTGASLSSNGGDCFLAKFDARGAELWSKPVNLYWLDECFDVATDASGNIVVVGRLVVDTNFDVLVRKFSPAGDVLWTSTVSTPAREEGRGVAIAPDGAIFVSGTTSITAGENVHSDITLTKFDRDGKAQWTKYVDLAGGDDEGRGASADSAGGVYVTGFGLVGGEKQSVVVKFTQSGAEVWRDVPGRPGIDGTGSIAVTPDGQQIAIAGALQASGSDFDFLLVSYTVRAPVAKFSVAATDPLRAGDRVTFTDTSAAGDRAIVSRLWDFGDGTTSNDTGPTHTYTTSGQFAVRLTAVDEWSTQSWSEQRLTIGTAAAAIVSAPTVDTTAEESKTPAPPIALLLVSLAVVAWLVRPRR